MRDWRYRAVGPDGRRHSGTLPADGEADLEARLLQAGMLLIAARPRRRPARFASRRRLGKTAILRFTDQLEQLLASGVPVVDALLDMAASPGEAVLRGLATDLATAIEAGSTLSDALAASEVDPGAVYIAMIRVGEQTGQLAETLADLVALLRWQQDAAARLRRALFHPLLIVLVLSAVVPFLLIWLVPRLASFLDAVGGELPAQTIALIALSAFVADWWALLLAVLFGCPLLVVAAARVHPRLRLLRDGWVLRLPVFGNLVRHLEIARYTHALARMYAAGIAVPRAMHLAAALLGNAALRAAAMRACLAVDQGHQFSDALRRGEIFPPLVIRMARVGETTGALDRSLETASRFHARAADEILDRLEPAVQPVLTVLLGAIVGWIMLAVLGPVYHSITVIVP